MTQEETRLDELKLKYQSALNLIQQSGVNLSHIHVQDNKLFIQGQAPSQEIKNQIWNQIKLIDPTYSDLVADLTIQPSGQSSASAASSSSAQTGDAAEQKYTVQSGDSLSKISQQFYGTANNYMRIFDANRDQLSDPNKINPGQVLKIPPK